MAGQAEQGKIDWMYEGKNSAIDREAFLLGKRIQKPADDKGDFIVEDPAKEKFAGDILERLDFESKLREDPLMSIKKTEEEKRRELLSNPIKRKHLQSMLKTALEKDLMKSKKKSSKSKKKHQNKREKTRKLSSSDILSSAKTNSKIRDSIRAALENELNDGSDSLSSSDSSSDSDSETTTKHQHTQSKHNRKKYEKSAHSVPKNSNSRSQSPQNKNPPVDKPAGYGLIVLNEKSMPTVDKAGHQAKPLPPQPAKPVYKRKHQAGFTSKLSADDLEKKRREMMQNADWRDDQRKKKIKKYDQEESIEKLREQKLDELRQKREKKVGKSKTFLHDVKLRQADVGSLEDTVRRKKHALNKGVRD